MRNAFIDELIALAETNPQIALVVGDLGFGVVEPFAARFPKRFFNAGVAEQSMMGLCAGLASEGFHVFAYSIANFPTFRCAEQIRNDVDYHCLPVTVVSVGGGLAYGNLGYSHHAIQDYALIRSMPNMLIAAPGDPMEVRACMRYLVCNPQPSYLRLGKSGEPIVHANVPTVAPGVLVPIRRGSSLETFISTGAVLPLVRATIDTSASRSHWSHYSMPLWGMSTKQLVPGQLSQFQRILTVEDHLCDGGFGSWMLETSLNHPEVMRRLGVRALDPKVCGLVGQQAALNVVGGLSPVALAT
jgi:transketolase